MTQAAKPRVLLAEDDPVSREFIVITLRELGCEVEAVCDGDAAHDATFSRKFDLLILDHRLPNLDGNRVLEITRANPYGADNRNTPAIATTADPDSGLHQWLRDAAGFDLVLLKPSSKSQLRKALQSLGLFKNAVEQAVLDGDAALVASGSTEILTALRGLFAIELDALMRDFDALKQDRTALQERLHRLRAACGFCGAMALQSAAAALSDALHDGDPAGVAERAADFRQTLAATREALDK